MLVDEGTVVVSVNNETVKSLQDRPPFSDFPCLVRHALYIAVTTSVRKEFKGFHINSVIYEYFQRKIETKTKKHALGSSFAFMQELFALLIKQKLSRQVRGVVYWKSFDYI